MLRYTHLHPPRLHSKRVPSCTPSKQCQVALENLMSLGHKTRTKKGAWTAPENRIVLSTLNRRSRGSHTGARRQWRSQITPEKAMVVTVNSESKSGLVRCGSLLSHRSSDFNDGNLFLLDLDIRSPISRYLFLGFSEAFFLGLQVPVVSLIRSFLLHDSVPMSFSPKDKLLYWIKVYPDDLISSYLLLCRDLGSSYCLDMIFASWGLCARS